MNTHAWTCFCITELLHKLCSFAGLKQHKLLLVLFSSWFILTSHFQNSKFLLLFYRVCDILNKAHSKLLDRWVCWSLVIAGVEYKLVSNYFSFCISRREPEKEVIYNCSITMYHGRGIEELDWYVKDWMMNYTVHTQKIFLFWGPFRGPSSGGPLRGP